jgi:hypothetical protein
MNKVSLTHKMLIKKILTSIFSIKLEEKQRNFFVDYLRDVSAGLAIAFLILAVVEESLNKNKIFTGLFLVIMPCYTAFTLIKKT